MNNVHTKCIGIENVHSHDSDFICFEPVTGLHQLNTKLNRAGL